MTKEKKPLKVEIEWKLLERIAQYYEFPTAVFLFNDESAFPEKTRHEALLKRGTEFKNKLNALLDEYFGD